MLLALRPRSREELGQRLARKKFDNAIIEATLAFLQEKKFIDDLAFAREWIAFRLAKSYGLLRIRQELAFKGVAPSIIERCCSEAAQGISEQELVTGLVNRKVSQYKGVDPQKAKTRLYGYLLRRGFSPEIILEELSRRFPF